MKRRNFLGAAGGAVANATGLALLGRHAPGWAQGVGQRASSLAERILILIELKGGNDGLNTVVPYADPAYYQLRNSIGIKAEELIKIDARAGLHPELKPMLPLWEKGELGVVQGRRLPQPQPVALSLHRDLGNVVPCQRILGRGLGVPRHEGRVRQTGQFHR